MPNTLTKRCYDLKLWRIGFNVPGKTAQSRRSGTAPETLEWFEPSKEETMHSVPISDQAFTYAKRAAAVSGVTVPDYLETLIIHDAENLDDGVTLTPDQIANVRQGQADVTAAWRAFTRPIKCANTCRANTTHGGFSPTNISCRLHTSGRPRPR